MAAFFGRIGVNITALGFTRAAGTGFSKEAFDKTMPPARLAYVKSCGFDTVRLAVDPSPLLAAASDAALAGYFDTITHSIDRCAAAGLKIIVDNHVSGDDPTWANTKIQNNDASMQRMRTIVGRLALVLRARSPSQTALEQWNETTLPTGRSWPEMAHALWQSARGMNAEITILVSGASWANRTGLIELEPTRFDQNTGFVFHNYEPAVFTGQGIPSLGLGSVTGLTFPADENQEAAILQEQNRMRESYVASYIRNAGDASAFVRKQFAPVRDWCSKHHVAPERIFITEFGVSKFTPPASRLLWLRLMSKAAADARFAAMLWSYNANDVWDVTDGTWIFPQDVLDALGVSGRQ